MANNVPIKQWNPLTNKLPGIMLHVHQPPEATEVVGTLGWNGGSLPQRALFHVLHSDVRGEESMTFWVSLTGTQSLAHPLTGEWLLKLYLTPLGLWLLHILL